MKDEARLRLSPNEIILPIDWSGGRGQECIEDCPVG